MTLTWLAKRHRTIFFIGLLIAYVAVLYAIATPEHDNFFRTCVRLAAPVVELALIWLVCGALQKLALQMESLTSSIFYAFIPLLVGLIYAAQIYSLYISGNFITVLAMQNSAESRIVRGVSMYFTVALAIVWWLFFLAGYVFDRRIARTRNNTNHPATISIRRLIAGAILLLGIVVFFHAQKDNGLLEADYRQAPLTAFVRSYYDSKRTVTSSANIDSHALPGHAPGMAATFPFEKSSIYDGALPFKTKGDSDEPLNVIVIFTEGTSTRLLGCYGGKYPGLTPNIDRLAQVSMRVVNYYNHTAATYRGLQGQLVSGYPAAGGGEDGAPWGTESGKKAASSIHYRSVPMILQDNHYRTYFISPHYDSVGLNTLLRTLGFDKVYSFEDVSHDIAPGNKFYYVEGALSDGDIFHALQILMTKGTISSQGHPFFMGLYNFGTHAFIDVMPNGDRYGNGSNTALNKLHNYDHAIGDFLDYFFASPYAKNTILILTADHATYPDQDYRAVAGADYKPLFVDRIPLIIYDPRHQLPAVYDAQGRTSIDLAPTLMQFLGIQHGNNSFLGTSLFEKDNRQIGFAAIGNEFFATDIAGVYPENSVPAKYAKSFSEGKQLVESYYQLEQQNRIFQAAGSSMSQ